MVADTLCGRLLRRVRKQVVTPLLQATNLQVSEENERNVSAKKIGDVRHQFGDLKVADFSIGADDIVMYHVDVGGPHGPLSTYTIRRRYTDFKHLHQELARIMVSSTSLTELQRAILFQAYPCLPELPDAGILSYVRRYDRALLLKRQERFQEILNAAAKHPLARESLVFLQFLSVAPSTILNRGSSYVSLRDYSVPRVDFGKESIVQKRKAAHTYTTGRVSQS